VRGVWLYLYLVIDVWSRKVVAWDVAEREEAQIAADLVSRACLRERISKGRPKPLILHADNGNAMRAATLESRLEELGVLRSFSRPRVSNANPYSESLFRTVKYRPDYPRRPSQSIEEPCAWVAGFVGWYDDRHRHSGIMSLACTQPIKYLTITANSGAGKTIMADLLIKELLILGELERCLVVSPRSLTEQWQDELKESSSSSSSCSPAT